ncbi:hypothetical protein BGZ79_001779, partial [Entomortierella chlamydospora]
MKKGGYFNKLNVHSKDNKGLTTSKAFGQLTEYFKGKLMADQKLRGGMDLETLTIAQ